MPPIGTAFRTQAPGSNPTPDVARPDPNERGLPLIVKQHMIAWEGLILGRGQNIRSFVLV